MTDSTQTSPQDSKSFDFAALLEIIRERWWLVPLCLILSLGLGLLYIILTPKSYVSQTVVEVEQSATKVLNVQDLISEDLKQDQVLKTIEQNLVSGEVLQAVIAQLKLTPSDLGLATRQDGGYLEGELSDALRKMVSAKLKRGTRLIIVSAESTDPKLARNISATLVAKYIQLNLDQRIGIASQASDYLSEEAIRAKARIDLAEEAAQEYKNAHPGVPLDDTAQFIGDKMLVLVNKVNDARQTRIRLEADMRRCKRSSPKATAPIRRINSSACKVWQPIPTSSSYRRAWRMQLPNSSRLSVDTFPLTRFTSGSEPSSTGLKPL